MEKKESRKAQDIKNQTFEAKKLNNAKISNNKKEKSLPWWVELLFVQIGLPDKWLIKLLKSRKKTLDLLKNEKKLIVIFLFVLAVLTYFYPVVKYSRNRLDCEYIAKKYIINNKKTIKITNKKLGMLSTNFCNGGDEINQIESLKD